MALPFYPAKGLPGMPTDGRFGTTGRVITRAAQQFLGFGKFVSKGANDKRAKLPTIAADVTTTGLGFVIRDQMQDPNIAVDGYAQFNAVPILEDGPIYLTCETVAAFGGQVYVRITTATDGTDLGNIRNDGDSGKAILLPRARFEETITAAGLVAVNVKMGGAT